MSEVPDVKYMSMGSVTLVALKSTQPSLFSPTRALSCSEGMFSAASTEPLMLDWSVQMTALTLAALILYSMSCLVSMWVAGAAMAPILWRATMQNQNWYLCFRISMTTSPLPMPCERR